jgi:hypothetical protein
LLKRRTGGAALSAPDPEFHSIHGPKTAGVKAPLKEIFD